ncbi:MAG TPA: DUF2177 family protein [Patescibacteria group bacterium]|nr:DUF2177 family protein [Patescibacteria group bacterium]
MEIVWSLIIAGVVMGVLDALWLGVVAKTLYYRELGGLLREKPNMAAALAFYVIYVVGVVVFVIHPALQASSLVHAALYGLLFGFVAYATYDLTNLATVKNFSSKIVMIDLVWGAVITAVVSSLTYIGVTWLV